MERLNRATRGTVDRLRASGVRRAFAWAVVAWLLVGVAHAGQVVDASIEEARRALLAGIAERDELSLHASLLIDSRDLTTLTDVLDVDRGESSRDAVLATLSALAVRSEPGLISSLVRLAASSDDDVIAQRAGDTVIVLARSHDDVVMRLRAWSVDTSMRSPDERVVCVRALGASRNLSAVPDLIDLVGGPLRDEAHAALAALTGNGLVIADADAWRTFWEPRRALPREELLELELDRLRTAPRRAFQERERQLEERLSEKDAEIEALTLLYIGTDIDRLIEELANESRDIRLEVARRLKVKSTEPRSEVALPMLARRLVGRSTFATSVTPDLGSSNGASGAVITPTVNAVDDAVEMERDPEVRALLVEALGKIGRREAGVTEVLVAELSSAYPVVSAAAVRALSHQKDRSEIVEPLLSSISGASIDDELLVAALTAIAANQPDASVLPRISPWLRADTPDSVREAAVLAALATPDVGAALNVIELDDKNNGVRYRIASGLSDAVGDLDRGPAYAQVGDALSVLLRDDDASVRAEAASALGVWGGTQALPWLADRSRIENEPSVLKRIVEALGMLGRFEAVDHIGRVSGQHESGKRPEIREAAQDAIERIGADGAARDWLNMGRDLRTANAYHLASWALLEMERRFGMAPEHADDLEEAKGMLAQVLFADGKYEQARTTLRELEQDGARFPPRAELLALLARANEQLGEFKAAAAYDRELLNDTPEGDVNRFQIQRNYVRTLFGSGNANFAESMLTELIEKAEGSDEPKPLLVELLFEHAEILETLDRQSDLARVIERLSELVEGRDSRERLANLRARVDDANTSDARLTSPRAGAARTG